MMSNSVTGVPADQVGRVVQDFINEGAARVIVEQAEDQTYTISAG
jgi:hypothetical protein